MNLPRKIITASISGTLFAIILGLAFPNPFGDQQIASFQGYFFSAVSSTCLYMLYSFPVILTYGVLTSLVSDKIGEIINNKAGGKKTEIVVTGIMHFIFGLILLWYSLTASILFFITDRIMRTRRSNYRWLDGIKSLLFPILTYLLLMAIIWGKDIFNNL